MSSWRKKIIDTFNYEPGSMVLVHDTDFLLNDEIILRELTGLDYEIIRFEDSVSFRYTFEQNYRQHDTPYKLLVYTNDAVTFPYEYVRQASQVELTLKQIFPKLSTRIIRGLAIDELDVLYDVYSSYQGTDSDRETTEFLVKYLYKIPYEIINSEVDLYKILLSLHYEKRALPTIIQQFLLNKWDENHTFIKLPVRKLLNSQTYFFEYIGKMWEAFVNEVSRVEIGQINDGFVDYFNHPLVHSDVRRLMSDLFLEGVIKRMTSVKNANIPKWMQLGIEMPDMLDNEEEKLLFLQEKIYEELQSVRQYKEWIEIIKLVSEYKTTIIQHDLSTYKEAETTLFQKINNSFNDWMKERFHTLLSLPPYPNPKLVHHIPQVINRARKENEKVALLVLDGMSFVQWRTIQKYLQTKDFIFEEKGVFSWVPTLTSVSRQSIFSGLMPLHFPKTIHTTYAEERLWKTFWEKQGVMKQYVTYQKSMGKEAYDVKMVKGLSKKSTKIYGAVIDVIDQFSHHAVLGEESIASDLNIWLKSDYLTNLLNDLINANYTIYITSDHGNTVAKGIGRFSEGVLVDQRGERVRLYNDKTFYQAAAETIPGQSWSNVGLPGDYYALFSQYGEAFTQKDKELITHGGISIEEVIVPFVKVQKNQGSE